MNTPSRNYFRFILLTAAFLACSFAPPAKPIIIKLATLAPIGSPWYDVILDITQEWQEITDNQVQVKLYPGGVAGDERDLITKMRLNHIQAAAMTATGISEVDKGIWGLSIPLILDDYNQLDWLRAQIEDELVRRLEEAGFIALAWADVGWVYWFSRDPVYVPEDLKGQRIFTWSSGPNVEGLWKSGGFHSVSVASTDVLPALQTGLIDAIGTTPLVAATSQWFGIAKYMNPQKWSVMTGGILITKRAWEQIPAELRPKLRASIEGQQDRIHNEIRYMDDGAVDVMKEYGLTVVELTPEQRASWREWLEPEIHQLRGLLTDSTMYDMIMELCKELPPPATASTP
ncbi:TRAP transporter substrate-binding protein DctP [Candidatus Neomarinimicrobiota bacterium]